MSQRVGAVLAIGVAGALALAAPAAAASSATPYRDPAASGTIGLCDRAGHQVTHGSTAAAPFAWRAVSSVAAPAGYAAGGTATLMAYQPRRGVPSGDWSGDQLTSASRYSNPAHPTAAATRDDESLRGFLTEYAPQWDGLIELRLYLGAPNQPLYSLTYPSLNIQVTGDTWHVVGGASVPCDSGRSVSLESIVLSPTTSKAARPPRGRRTEAVHPQTAGAVSPAAASTAAVATTAGGHGPVIVVAVVAAVALLAGGRMFFARRRPASTNPSR